MRRRALQVLLAAIATSVVPFWPPGPARVGAQAVRHSPPVHAPVVDGFRPPAHPWSAGNRGLEYATTPGAPVVASADGEVLFAGEVASTLHVTVLHDDGLRTGYSYLATVEVEVGRRVRTGDVVGTSGSRLHFGVRDAEGTYVDPTLVLAGDLPRSPRLVPGAGEGLPALRAGERWDLAELVRATWDLASSGTVAAREAADQGLALASHYRDQLDPWSRLARMAAALESWRRSRSYCTPPGEAPRTPRHRRVVVLVAGLGSTGESGSVDDVDVAALGYARGDVLRYSYRGGRVPDPGDGASFSGVPASTYDALDTQGDLRAAGAGLARLLAQVAAASPGVPVDVIAHSQGGLVTRLALLEDGVPSELETVVTLGSPHGGSDWATAAAALGALPPVGGATESRVAAAAGLDPSRPAIRQLSETSDVVAELGGRDLLAPRAGGGTRRVRFVSVAARGDLVVPVPRTVVAGEHHVVVPLAGPAAHSELPGSPEATREIALAVAGQPPTCSSLASTLVDVATGEAISAAADAYGAVRMAGQAAGAGPP